LAIVAKWALQHLIRECYSCCAGDKLDIGFRHLVLFNDMLLIPGLLIKDVWTVNRGSALPFRTIPVVNVLHVADPGIRRFKC